MKYVVVVVVVVWFVENLMISDVFLGISPFLSLSASLFPTLTLIRLHLSSMFFAPDRELIAWLPLNRQQS